MSSYTSRSAQVLFAGAQELLGEHRLEKIAAGISQSSHAQEGIQGLLIALEDIYGIPGGRGLAFRIGRAAFPHILKQIDPGVGLQDREFHLLPLGRRLEAGLQILAQEVGRDWGQTISVSDTLSHWLWRVEACPACSGRLTTEPCCHVLAGMLQAYMSWAGSGRYFRIHETECRASGKPACIFEIDKKPLD